MKKQTKKEILKDWEYWKELETVLPWKLQGFSYKSTGTYWTDKDLQKSIQISGEQRDQILKAIYDAQDTL